MPAVTPDPEETDAVAAGKPPVGTRAAIPSPSLRPDGVLAPGGGGVFSYPTGSTFTKGTRWKLRI